jgi:hypothetical protein
LAAAKGGETLALPRTLALREEGTNERDYTYTCATRALFSRCLTNEEKGGGPLVDIVDRGDKGSRSKRMSQFLEIYGGSLMMREVEWSNASPDLQWSSYFPGLSGPDTGP